ncbi:hypothetical protein GCM10011585_36700 [Edaphobacter dinghuensis]|uniref:Uncharacterized protein n=1 Tax=Edaphobacter dinghuensis TaxID=1560005 RepID=A0A917HT59_9BACT|nr:hypothetical protein GCM10011585_36700 [Edaphobacter dinghuensis]
MLTLSNARQKQSGKVEAACEKYDTYERLKKKEWLGVLVA